LEAINAELRVRKRLEKQYQKMLEDSNKTIEDIVDNSIKQL
jgi:hypothetical protein